ncbi:MAG TPA: hypothetical protein DCE41_08320 [Cytophagales bacterium]|nr:hypothetical protein [Cytophagales bacterium]
MSNFLFELAVVHGALILGYWLLLRGERNYTQLRQYLLAATAVALYIPLMKLPRLYQSASPAPGPSGVGTVAVERMTVIPLEEASPWYIDLLIGIYVVVSGILLLKFLYNVGYLIYLERKSRYEQFNQHFVRKVCGVEGSFTFFRWIFLSDSISKEHADYEVILKHEEAHVALRHTYDLLLFELFKVCFWWLPTAWFASREIRKIHEYQADAYALKTCSYDRYSTILISSTLTIHGLGLASSFHDGSILNRLHAMKQQTKNVSPWKLGALASLCALLVVALACTEDQAEVAEVDSVAEEAIGEFTSFELVEEQPEPAGGTDAFYAYLASQIDYPQEARKLGIEGRVYLEFIVEKDGSLSNIQVMRGIWAGCDDEAKRILENAPAFNPGKQRGKAVRVQMRMPITFKLKPEGTNPDGSAMGMVVIDSAVVSAQTFQVEASYDAGKWVGTVYSADGKTLPGVNVFIPGTSKGVVSDLFGKFELPVAEDQEVHVSFVGYQTAKLEVK